MKNEITIRKLEDISGLKPNSAACVTNKGKMLLTFHGEAPGLPKWLRVTDSSGKEYYVHRKKLADLLMGRKG